ncbi:MAG TPA: AMP-binding protein [Bryobacteraceae bacterium]|nr:AMP-binding protein [Bryobacteraceae bacterium]
MSFPASRRTVYTLLEETAAAHGDQPALHQPISHGKYQTWTWREFRDIVQWTAVGLSTMGAGKGSMIALQCETRAEFYFADLGVMAAGAVAAAVYTSVPYADQARAIQFCDCRIALVENAKAYRGLANALGDAAREIRWILLTGDAEEAGATPESVMTLAELWELGRRKLAEDPSAFERLRAQYNDADLAILYMTSGATGEPKMGVVSHRALVTNLDMTPTVLPLSPVDCTIAFLPSAHMAQRMVAELLPILTGATVWFSEGLSKLPHELRAIRPTLFLSPPRLWERIHASIVAEIKKKPAVLRKLFHLGLGLGNKAARLRREGRPVPLAIQAPLRLLDKIMFSKIRERFGARLRAPVSGSAPLSKDLAEFYEAVGMPLIEGYGLTEGGVVSVNPLDRPKPGSIGKLLPGVEVRIEEDGELMIHGSLLFDGYYKDPEATAAVLRDGWLATGDIAECDSEGYYYITGRKKELIVASNGKKIYPARIEGLFKREPLISHVMLIGDKLPFVTALITTNGDPAAAAPAVERAVKDVNRQLPAFEQIRKFKILDRDFSIENGEMTPTMKLRKSRILENHRGLVHELYAGREFD